MLLTCGWVVNSEECVGLMSFELSQTLLYWVKLLIITLSLKIGDYWLFILFANNTCCFAAISSAAVLA